MVEILVAAGADAAEATEVADVLGWADERQRYPQGCVWLDTLVARLRAGVLHSPAPCVVTTPASAVARVDAGGGFGQVATSRAVELAAERAHAFGVGLAVVVNSTHFGAAGYYAERLAASGHLGLVMSNAYPKVAAHGGTRPVLGTNPLAFSVPTTDDDGVLGDLSSGAIAGSRVREAIERGELLAEGTALDADGRPTRDPSAMEAGGVMLPAAGPKGYALGLLVELFTSVLGAGAVAGAVGSVFDTTAAVGVSHTVLAIRPLDDDFAARAGGLLELVRTGAGADSAVRIPGAARSRAAAEAREHGIDLPGDSLRRLRAVAGLVGVELPDVLQRT
jgi:LDH2 family malate/lactate/ureidoglycolate dehydrogenase